MNKMNGVEQGRCGEDLAAAFLLKLGYRILNRNWRLKTGEIDIIADHAGVLVFCEVKTRRSLLYGSGAEAVGRRKQQRIIRTALLYMQGLPDRPCRFDVIEVLLLPRQSPAVNHIVNAFGTWGG